MSIHTRLNDFMEKVEKTRLLFFNVVSDFELIVVFIHFFFRKYRP